MKSTLLIIALTLGCGSVAAAPLLAAGTQEWSIHASPDFEGAVGDMLQLDIGIARFLAERLSVRGALHHILLEDVAGADKDYRMTAMFVGLEYHLDLSDTVVPYVGAGVGWVKTQFGVGSDSAAAFGPRAGIKFFLADNVALDWSLAYRLSSEKVFINDFKAEDSDLTPSLGFRYLH